MSKRWVLLVFTLVVVSRLPFLGPGYGLDPDAWRFAEAAREMVRAGTYRESRLPGYPVPEIAYALTAGLVEGATDTEPPSGGYGSLALPFNALVALLSGIAAVAFGSALARMGARDPWAGALALAFTPVVYVQSTGAMDYVWTLAFLMLALERAVAGRSVAAGLLCGVAIGTRLGAAVALAPLAVIVAAPLVGTVRDAAGHRPPAPVRLLQLVAAALLVAGIAFLPVVLTHGAGFLAFVDQKKPLTEILSRASFGVFGVLGCAGLLAVLLLSRLERTRPSVLHDVPREHVVAWVIGLTLFGAVYLRLPIEAGFLIPAVPFGLLLLFRMLSRPHALALAAVLVLAPFVNVVRSGPRPGPVLWDHRERVERGAIVDEVIDVGHRLGPDAVIVAGYLMPQLRVTMGETGARGEGRATFIYLPEEHELRSFLASGRHVYVVPGQETFHHVFHEYDLFAEGAEPLILTGRRSAP